MNKSSALSLLLLLLFTGPEMAATAKEVVRVEMEGGRTLLTGTVELSLPGGRPFHAFRSLRFASPPVGALRFRAPSPIIVEGEEVKTKEEDATKPTPQCPQLQETAEEEMVMAGQEDCLFLNVYTPVTTPREKTALPVLVFFHGGGFVSGSSSSLGPEYLMDPGSVVVVTANYRLGPLGWISNEDEQMPGNLGLLDQSAALEWVRANVASFGGDAGAVTVGGHGFGGGSAVADMLASTAFEGLFSKAIIMSGPTVGGPLTRHGDSPSYYASSFVGEVGCDEAAETEEMVDCLQKKPLEALLSASKMFWRFTPGLPNPWKPVQEDAKAGERAVFPNGGLKEALDEGNFHKVPVMMGSVENEGSHMMRQFLESPEKFDEVNDDFDSAGTQLLLNSDDHSAGEEDSSTANIIRLHYLNNGTFSRENAVEIALMFSDVCYRVPIHAAAVAIADKSDRPVYYYRFSYRDGDGDGAGHGDDLNLLFKTRGKEVETQEDRKMSKKLVLLWTRFVASTAPDSRPDPRWLHLRETAQEEEEEEGGGQAKYAVLDGKPIRMAMEHEFKENYDFVRSMNSLMESYRAFDISKHPAVIELMKTREENAEEYLEAEHDEL